MNLRILKNESYIFFVKIELLDPEDPYFAVLGNKISQRMIEKD